MYYYFVMYRADRLYSIDDEYNSNVYFRCNSVKQYLEDFCTVHFKSLCVYPQLFSDCRESDTNAFFILKYHGQSMSDMFYSKCMFVTVNCFSFGVK